MCTGCSFGNGYHRMLHIIPEQSGLISVAWPFYLSFIFCTDLIDTLLSLHNSCECCQGRPKIWTGNLNIFLFFTDTSFALFALFDKTVNRNLMCHYCWTNQGFCLHSDFWKLFFFPSKKLWFYFTYPWWLCVLLELHVFLTYYFDCQWFWWPISKCISWHTVVWVILLSKLYIRNCVSSPWGASQ